MVDGSFFESLDQIGRLTRNSGKPFGGIQLGRNYYIMTHS